MTNKPLTRTLGVKGTLLFFVMFLSFLLVACGGGSNVPVGTPLYPDKVSAANASPPATDFVTESDNVWIDQTAVLTTTNGVEVFTIEGVWQVEVRGRVADAQGKPPVMYIRKADIPQESTNVATQPSEYAFLLTVRSWHIPFWFILFLLALIPVFRVMRENLVELDKTFPITGYARSVQTARNTELNPISYTIFYTISTNSGPRAAFFGTGQAEVEEIIKTYYESAIRAGGRTFPDDNVVAGLPGYMSHLPQDVFPTLFLENNYGVIIISSVLGKVDFPQKAEDRTIGALKQQTDEVEYWYKYLNRDVKPGQPELISRPQVQERLMWRQNAIGTGLMHVARYLDSDTFTSAVAGYLNLQQGAEPMLAEEDNNDLQS